MEKYKYKTRSMSSITPCPHGVTAECTTQESRNQRLFTLVHGWKWIARILLQMRRKERKSHATIRKVNCLVSMYLVKD